MYFNPHNNSVRYEPHLTDGEAKKETKYLCPDDTFLQSERAGSQAHVRSILLSYLSF